MKTRVFGKKIEERYVVNLHQATIEDEQRVVFTNKPELDKKTAILDWEELCSYDGEPRYNSSKYQENVFSNSYNTMNISESERVVVEEEIFRADLNEMHLYTNKIVSKIEPNAVSATQEYNYAIKQFNKQMIMSNDQLKAYCNLHKLSYEDTNCVELFTVVFPGEQYEIKDGKMKIKEKQCVIIDNAKSVGYMLNTY